MNKNNEQDKRFETLLHEITAAEEGLRDRFERTPLPSPQVLARIKSQLRTEARPARLFWPLWASSIAAAVLLAIGAGLFYQSQGGQPPQTTALKGHDAEFAGLDAFTASLPAVEAAEDPAVRELSSDLKELESQTSKILDETNQAEQPEAKQPGQRSEGALAWGGGVASNGEVAGKILTADVNYGSNA